METEILSAPLMRAVAEPRMHVVVHRENLELGRRSKQGLKKRKIKLGFHTQ